MLERAGTLIAAGRTGKGHEIGDGPSRRPRRVVVGPDLSADGVGNAEFVFHVGSGRKEYPIMVVDPTTVEHFDQELPVVLSEKPHQAGIFRADRHCLTRPCRSVEAAPVDLDPKSFRAQAEIRLAGDAGLNLDSLGADEAFCLPGQAVAARLEHIKSSGHAKDFETPPPLR